MSTLLCSLYLADLERKHLAPLLPRMLLVVEEEEHQGQQGQEVQEAQPQRRQQQQPQQQEHALAELIARPGGGAPTSPPASLMPGELVGWACVWLPWQSLC